MHSTRSEWKFVVSERSIGTLRNKTHKCMTLILKNAYIDILDDIK